MIYLVGGAPRVGKSQFMQKVIERKPMTSISLDFLYDLDQVKNLNTFSGLNILEKGRAFYHTLKQLLINISLRSEDCIIEGEVIIPEFIKELSEDYNIRCCFLGLSNTDLETILKHGGFFNWPQYKLDNNMQNEVEDLPARVISKSKIIESECIKNNLQYFELSNNYDEAVEKAVKYLLNK